MNSQLATAAHFRPLAPPVAAPAPVSWSGPLVVEQYTSGAAEWDDYVSTHPDGNVYHLSAWRAVAERAYGLKCPFIAVRAGEGGSLCGVLPLFVVDGPLRRYITSGLFGSYGVVLADDEGVRRRLLAEARRVAATHRARFLQLKSLGDAPPPADFTRVDSCVIGTLPLQPDPNAMWKGFRDKIRNSVRKAEKSGLTLRVGGAELLDSFYDVLAENMHRKGTPIYGFPVMTELCSALGDAAQVYTLWKDDVAVSGALVLNYKGRVYVPFASSRAAYFSLNPNNLLYWEIIRRGCEAGMKLMDFGRSPRDSSTLAFKRHFGAISTSQPFDVYTLRGNPPQLDHEDPTVQRLTHFWQSLPRAVADKLGPEIYKRYLI